MSKKILLADDSVTIQKVVELTFMDEGVTVVAVGNGSDAIARLAEVDPDVVIADVHMPGASGYEVSRRVKDLHPDLPVLLLVGTFEPFSKEDFAACGADASMKKPFDSQELLREVTQMLERSPQRSPVAEEPLAEAAEWELDDTGALEPSVVPELDALPERPEMPAVAAQPEAAAPPPAPAPGTPAAAPMAIPAMSDAASAVAPVEVPRPAATAPSAAGAGGISDADVDRIARRVVELIGDRVVREVSWEVIPDLAEVVIKDRLRELESQVE